MKQYVESNSKEVSVVAVNKVKRAIEKCETEKKYNNSAEKIALYIISSGREITNLLYWNHVKRGNLDRFFHLFMKNIESLVNKK